MKSIMEEDARRYREENRRLEKMLGEMGKKLEETEAVLEKEQNKMKLLWIKRRSTSKKKKLNRSKPFDESMHAVIIIDAIHVLWRFIQGPHMYFH